MSSGGPLRLLLWLLHLFPVPIAVLFVPWPGPVLLPVLLLASLLQFLRRQGAAAGVTSIHVGARGQWFVETGDDRREARCLAGSIFAFAGLVRVELEDVAVLLLVPAGGQEPLQYHRLRLLLRRGC